MIKTGHFKIKSKRTEVIPSCSQQLIPGHFYGKQTNKQTNTITTTPRPKPQTNHTQEPKAKTNSIDSVHSKHLKKESRVSVLAEESQLPLLPKHYRAGLCGSGLVTWPLPAPVHSAKSMLSFDGISWWDSSEDWGAVN